MIPAYDAATIHRLLDMPGCIAVVRKAMARFSADATAQPLRSVTELEPGKLFALMPGSLVAPDGFGAKLLSIVGDPERPGRSRHLGLVVLFDRATGELRCTGDAESITAIRTAAASAVATDAMARPDARTAAVFGTGEQARSHVLAMAAIRPFEEIVVWGRSAAAAQELVVELQPEMSVLLRAEPCAHTAAAGADVICTVTGATTPILLGEWVRPGTHINVVGSGFAGPVEVDNALVARAWYIADSRRSALAAAAEFLEAKAAGRIGDDHIRGEIGDVLNGTVLGRPSDEAVTIYKSLGHVVQDLAAMAYVDDRAKALA
jgi:ornithine cyclodeaminase